MPSDLTPETVARKVLDYHHQLRPDWELPKGISLIFPYDRPETQAAMSAFYHKYYGDRRPRVFLFGINPGRFGAGITGIPFTDPLRLREDCGIANAFPPRGELSSEFVYRIVHALGGPAAFFGQYYITSVCPLGFLKDGRNYNYYDQPALLEAVRPRLLDHLREQTAWELHRSIAVSIGRGKNYTLLKELNAELGLFRKVLPLPHPRWVMQYRRRELEQHIRDYCDTLRQVWKRTS